jgi:CubicO group peptidase (beta-lactamase class C family)
LIYRFVLAGCLLPALVSARAAARAVPDTGLAAQIDSSLVSSMAVGFSGAVIVHHEGTLVIDQGYGFMKGVAMKPTTRFWIASVGKQFTSAAILRCQERGWLTLEDPISRFVSAPKDKRGITIRQLLAHQSGLASTNVSETATDRLSAVNAILSQPLADQPGARFIYSNDNYQLAAAIVEIVSHKRYEDFVPAELLKPAGLRNTGQTEAGRDPSVAPLRDGLPRRLLERRWGQEGFYSTTSDLLTWYRMLRSGEILTRRSVDQLFAPVTRIHEGEAALGWFVGTTDTGRRRIFTRGNEDNGPNALIYAYPDTDTVIIVLTHAGDHPNGLSYSRAVQAEIERILFP